MPYHTENWQNMAFGNSHKVAIQINGNMLTTPDKPKSKGKLLIELL